MFDLADALPPEALMRTQPANDLLLHERRARSAPKPPAAPGR
ncbi:hypothetical protein V5P93_003857 [Actinokineospora auranticolor]|nr:hypothetical protein [Actinokineospora auranticolor]